MQHIRELLGYDPADDDLPFVGTRSDVLVLLARAIRAFGSTSPLSPSETEMLQDAELVALELTASRQLPGGMLADIGSIDRRLTSSQTTQLLYMIGDSL